MENLNLKITNEQKHLQAVNERFSQMDKQKLAKAAKDFESMLTSMMLKSMTKTNEGFFGENNFGGDVYNTLFENEMASFMTNSKSMGIAEMIYKKVTGEELKNLSIKNLKPELPEIETKETPVETKKNTETPINTNGMEIPAIKPGNKSETRLEKFDSIIEQASVQYGIDKNIIKSVILAESAGNEKAISVARAKGLMQLLDSTAKDLGVNNIWDPKQNIFGGTKYLAGLLRQYNGDLKLALAGYNAGPGNVEKYNGVPPFNETKNYISRVMGYLNYFNG